MSNASNSSSKLIKINSKAALRAFLWVLLDVFLAAIVPYLTRIVLNIICNVQPPHRLPAAPEVAFFIGFVFFSSAGEVSLYRNSESDILFQALQWVLIIFGIVALVFFAMLETIYIGTEQGVFREFIEKAPTPSLTLGRPLILFSIAAFLWGFGWKYYSATMVEQHKEQ
jgi:hypothetical protein